MSRRIGKHLNAYLRSMTLAVVTLEGFARLGRIVESDPDLAAVVILERLRKLERRWEAVR